MIKILFHGINFYSGNFNEIFKKFTNSRILVAPAASALSTISKDKKYHNALINADIAILDSGFFCILLRLLKNLKVQKLSGYLFLNNFLNKKNIKNKKIYTINPSIIAKNKNDEYLRKKNFLNFRSYVAPKYNKILIENDKKLINELNIFKPRFIIINIGGGVQEILAQNISKKIKFKTSIMCTGAAIAFMTGEQAPINRLVDKFYLGWLIRLLFGPKKYFKRTISSFGVISLFK